MKFNKDYVLDIAKNLLSIDSPTGYTKGATEFLEKELSSLGYESFRNEKGNLMVSVEGKNNERHRAVLAHVDTLGLMVRSINSDGTLALTNLGGPIIPTLDAEYCRIITRDKKVYTGTILADVPAVHVYPDASTKERKIENMIVRIDEVVKTKEDVEKLGIQNGDIVAIDPKVQITESGFVKSRFLDDKISVSLLMGVLESIKTNKLTIEDKTTFIFSTYEEVGHGAASIPNDINEALAVDMGCIGLDLACTEYDVSICAKDSSGPYDYDMTTNLINLSKDNKLSYAVDIYPYYGSDVSAALRGGNNIKGALIGPGVHASHGMERTHYQAIENAMKLVMLYLQK
ncbi:M42 family metallopeptidase [Breznakia pachnodae]|uniref:Aminopeptidase FrvX n=1 Tax=Breznakia pachnodae TaxID=265178 RepID=A0ABU0DYI1_9FIRM|nr:M42 family metallopeptidase [Breznakia pachnodae]MDQ0359692.1 putative aminopeptidase FrvX [Breznakia pachnodae]